MFDAGVANSDVDFLIEKFSRITTRRSYKLPHEYCEEVRYIDRALTPFPGKFSFDKFPYFKEIIDCFAPDNPCRRLYLMKGNQLGATTSLLENIMAYFIGESPAPVLYVLPDEMMARDAMRVKIEPLIDGCGLRPLIFSQSKKAKGSKNTGDTAMKKEYPGGYLFATGGMSGSRFRNFSFKIALVDEVDGFKGSIKGEGDVLNLMTARLDAYPTSSKLYIGSTPTEEHRSIIAKLFDKGTKKYFYVPCKHCGKMIRLEWAVWDENDKSRQIGGIVWENDENFEPILETVAYKCPECGGLMKNYDKATIMQRGEWRATQKSKSPNVESYHLTALYNPPGMFSWEDYVSAWAGCWDIKNRRVKDLEKFRVFRNLKQGLPFKEQHETVRYERAIRFRRFGFARGTVPNKMAVAEAGSPVLILVGSVDVQKECLYFDVKGYADRGVCYTIDFIKIDGNTQQFGGPWDVLADYIENKEWCDEGNLRYRLAITLIDSGHYTDFVYSFVSRFTGGVYAIKGNQYIKGGETYQLFNSATLVRIGLPLAYHINTTKMKDRISNAMNTLMWNDGELQPPWFPNFPEDFGDDYFKMFEAEEKVEVIDKNTNKWIRTEWRAKFGAPNHALDSFSYAWAALEVFAEDICRHELGLPCLVYERFWAYAKATEAFYYRKSP